ncbi:MAG: tetratricopeptide repeat protein [Endomicrobia bacterium]|nr:tetratricopeptide repeat protein [Endomicrobiia bacterium]
MNKTFILSLCILTCVYWYLYPFKQTYYFYSKGLLDLQNKNYKSAIENFEKVIHNDPQATDVYFQLAHLYILEGQDNKINDLVTIMENNVEDVIELKNVAELLISFNYLDEATKLLEKILRIEPQNKDVLLMCAQIFYNRDYEKSLSYYKRYNELYPEDSSIYLPMSMLEYKLGNYDKARQLLKKVSTEDVPSETMQLIETLMSLPTSFDLLDTQEMEVIISEPSSIAAMFYFLTIKKDFDKAEKYLSQLLKLPKKEFHPDWYFYIAVFYEYKGDLSSAIKYMLKYLKHAEITNELPYIKLAYYYMLGKKYKNAKDVLLKAKKKYNVDNIKIVLSYLYIENKDYKSAVSILHELEKSTTVVFRTNFYLAFCYDQLGNFEKTEYYLRQAIKQNPNDHEALNYLGYLYADKNLNLDEAEQLITKALSLEPTNYAYIDSLAWVYYRKQMYEKAEELFEKIKDCNDHIVYEHIGDTKYMLGKFEEALYFYTKSLTLNKKNNIIKKKIKKLNRELKSKKR